MFYNIAHHHSSLHLWHSTKLCKTMHFSLCYSYYSKHGYGPGLNNHFIDTHAMYVYYDLKVNKPYVSMDFSLQLSTLLYICCHYGVICIICFTPISYSLFVYYIHHTVLLNDCITHFIDLRIHILIFFPSLLFFIFKLLIYFFCVLLRLPMIQNIIHNRNTLHHTTSCENIYCLLQIRFLFVRCVSFCMFATNVNFCTCDLFLPCGSIHVANFYMLHKDLTPFGVLTSAVPCMDNHTMCTNNQFVTIYLL